MGSMIPKSFFPGLSSRPIGVPGPFGWENLAVGIGNQRKGVNYNHLENFWNSIRGAGYDLADYISAALCIDHFYASPTMAMKTKVTASGKSYF